MYTYLSSKGRLGLPLSFVGFDEVLMQIEENIAIHLAYSMDS